MEHPHSPSLAPPTQYFCIPLGWDMVHLCQANIRWHTTDSSAGSFILCIKTSPNNVERSCQTCKHIQLFLTFMCERNNQSTHYWLWLKQDDSITSNRSYQGSLPAQNLLWPDFSNVRKASQTYPPRKHQQIKQHIGLVPYLNSKSPDLRPKSCN